MTSTTQFPPRRRLEGQHWRAVYEPGPVWQFFGAVGNAVAAAGRGVARVAGWAWDCLSLLWHLHRLW